MKLKRHTVSLCPMCFREIPATVTVSNTVTMTKTCPQHKKFGPNLVERDPVYYSLCMAAGDPRFYFGYFVDVTERCNLKCQHCFYPCNTGKVKDPSIEDLLSDFESARMSQVGAVPIIFTGGEATLRPDILDLARATVLAHGMGNVCMVTNGTKLADKAFVKEIGDILHDPLAKGLTHLNVSIHPEAGESTLEGLGVLRSCGYKAESCLIVIDQIEQMENAVKFAREFGDSFVSLRIKAATRLWAEGKHSDRICVSDMLKWLEEHGEDPVKMPNSFAKVSWSHVWWKNLNLMLVSWYDRFNVDLVDINCAPWYRAKNGQIANFVTGCLINEGMDAGYLAGKKL